uniref:STAS domain-containing protein n=1 Tax=Ditylenchus dipsaci TaxID=166011 RepID=A0A915ELF1_9BILA
MDLFSKLDEIHTPTATISSCSIGFLLFSQKILEPWLSSVFRFPIPYELILVILGITATNFAKLSKRHAITVVGKIPTVFPPPALPPVAIHLTVVKIVEHRYHYRINSCQELYSLGHLHIARTLIGDADKNSTQMTVCFSTMTLLTVILFIGPALEYLPKCILASMVVVSLSASFSKFREVRALWPLFKFDFVIFVVSLLLTVCYDMAEGLTFTIIFAIFTIVVRDQWPKWHFLSHDEEINDYKETPKEQLHVMDSSMDACVLRYDAPLIFTSVHKFMKVVSQGVKRWERREFTAVNSATTIRSCSNDNLMMNNAFTSNSSGNTTSGCSTRWRLGFDFLNGGGGGVGSIERRNTGQQPVKATTLIIDCSGFPYVDYQGLCTLKKIYKDFSNEGVVVKFAAPKAVLMRMFRNTDFMEVVPPFEIFSTVRQAVQSTNANQRKFPLSHSVVEPKNSLEGGKTVERVAEEDENIQLMLKHDFATEKKAKIKNFKI